MNQITVAFCNDSITIELKQFGKIVLYTFDKSKLRTYDNTYKAEKPTQFDSCAIFNALLNNYSTNKFTMEYNSTTKVYFDYGQGALPTKFDAWIKGTKCQITFSFDDTGPLANVKLKYDKISDLQKRISEELLIYADSDSIEQFNKLKDLLNTQLQGTN